MTITYVNGVLSNNKLDDGSWETKRKNHIKTKINIEKEIISARENSDSEMQYKDK